jgi:type II secretory pathway component GspD/PulD (secretin)
VRRGLVAAGMAMALACPAIAQTARITIDVHDAALTDVISLLAAESGRNIVTDASVKPERVTLHLEGVTFQEALSVLVQAHGLQVRKQGAILILGSGDVMNKRYNGGGDALGPQTVVIALAHANPDDVAKEIGQGLPDGTVIVADKRTESVIVTGNRDTIARAKQLIGALDAPAYSANSGDLAHIYPLRYVKPSELAAKLKGVLPDGSYAQDDPQNAIVVSGNAETQRIAEQFVRSMDVAGPQVLFEVRVADLQPVNEQTNVGIEFGGYDLTGAPIAGAATYTFANNSIAINARLNLLVSEGRAQILATPKLVTLNNKEADLLIGQTYPVIYYDARLGGQQVQFVDIGVKLRLTPTIGSDGSVTAEMHPEYSAIQGFVGGYPVIANRKVDSTLRVKNDQTIVLGGLMREIDSQTLSKLPGLSDIPIIGKIFRNKQRTHQRDEVVFLITPHVIYPNTPPPVR